LGSTNGIEFAGQRVESKRIEEGDVYRICHRRRRRLSHLRLRASLHVSVNTVGRACCGALASWSLG
jgi:hypothetical protein